MARFMITLCLLLYLIIMVDSTMIDGKTCKVIENPITYETVQLECLYRGPGLYKFSASGRSQRKIKKVTFDRLSEAHVILMTDKYSHLSEFVVTTGTLEQCNLVVAKSNVMVKVGGKLCSDETTTPGIFSTTMTTGEMVTPLNTDHMDVDHTSTQHHTYTKMTTLTQNEEKTTPLSTLFGMTTGETVTPLNTGHVDPTSVKRQKEEISTQAITSEMSSTGGHIPYSPQEETTSSNTTPWIISTVVAIAENFEHLIIGLMSVTITLLQIMINVRQRLEALPAIHPHPFPPPHPVQNRAAQPVQNRAAQAQPQPPRRSLRRRRPVDRLNL